MTIVKEVTVEGIRYPVTVSDDNEALLAAAAAGRAIIGIWDPSVRPLGAGFDACLYLVCEMEAADDMLLEKAVKTIRTSMDYSADRASSDTGIYKGRSDGSRIGRRRGRCIL